MRSRGVEGREHLVGFPERRLRQRRRCAVAARVTELFQPRAQTAERGAQIVRDVVRDPAHVLHQGLDAFEHRVQVRDQIVELVAAPVALDAFGQLAFHDATRRVVDRLDTRRHAPPHPPGPRDPERHGDADTPRHRADDGRAHLVEIPQIAPDEQVVSARKLEVPGAGAAHLGAGGRIIRGVEPELDPALGAPRGLGPSGEIAREHPEPRIGEQIDRRAGGIAVKALGDEATQPPQSRTAVALREPLHLGFDHRLHLPGHVARGRPVDQHEQREHREPEQRPVADGDAPRDAAGDGDHGTREARAAPRPAGANRRPAPHPAIRRAPPRMEAIMARGSRSPRRARCG